MINFHSESIDFSLKNESTIEKWLAKAIESEGFTLGELNLIFCSDLFLYDLNVKYLNHDTYTDIITFNYVENKLLSGDLYISIDRITENALKFNVSFEEELSRVMVHGCLHLMGYNDKTNEESVIIRAKEDFYLALLSNM